MSEREPDSAGPDNQGRFCILLGGDLTPTARLRKQVLGCRAIAADGGMIHAPDLHLAAELWVGDFDSASAMLQSTFAHVPRQKHPRDKDKSDGELAIDVALVLGARHIVLAGGLGGQTDHALGNLALMLGLARKGIACFASSGSEEAYPLLPGERHIALPAGSRLSIIAFSDLAGLDIAGVRWPLDQASVPMGSTWTLSNVATGTVRVALTSGTALVLAAPATV